MQRKPKKTPLRELWCERVQEIAGIEQLSSRQKGIIEEVKADSEMQQVFSFCFPLFLGER
jgi:ribosomal protein L20